MTWSDVSDDHAAADAIPSLRDDDTSHQWPAQIDSDDDDDGEDPNRTSGERDEEEKDRADRLCSRLVYDRCELSFFERRR